MPNPIRDFYDTDLHNHYYGAHQYTYEEFFRALASAYQYHQNAPDDVRNGNYLQGPLGGLSGHDVVRLWEAGDVSDV